MPGRRERVVGDDSAFIWRCSRARRQPGSARRGRRPDRRSARAGGRRTRSTRPSSDAADRDEVEDRQVLDHTRTGRRRRRAGTPARRTWPPAAGSASDLVDAADPAGVDLAEVDRLGLEQLLEDHPVLRRARRSRPGSGGATARAIAAWPRTSSGLVGSSIQYGSNGGQLAHPVDRLVDVPALVGVDAIRTPSGPISSRAMPHAAHVVRRGRAPTLSLNMREARRRRASRHSRATFSSA